MRYTQRRFTVSSTTPEAADRYRDGYDRVFRQPDQTDPDSACGCDDRSCPRCQREDDQREDPE